MLQWPSTPSVLSKRRSGEESIGHLALLPDESLRPPPIRRWTLGVPKHALSGRTVLEPIETEKSEKVSRSRSKARTQTLEACSPAGSGRSSRVSLPPLDFAGELEDTRRIKGCRGASEYLARQGRSGLSAHEKFCVKEAFLRFKSSGAEINCSDLFDVLSHLGYLGITDETAALLAKEVSRFSTLDFKELLKVVESAGPWELEHLRTTFERYAASSVKDGDAKELRAKDWDCTVQLGDGEPSGLCKNGSFDPSPDRPDGRAGGPGPGSSGSSGSSGSFLHAAHLPFLLHAVGMTSEWQAIRETLVQALDLDLPQQPRLEGSDRDAEMEERMLFSFEQVNLILATHRAAQCSSVPLLECAETLFCSVAKTVNRRLEVNIHKVPELLRRLHEYDVSDSISEICRPLRSRSMDGDTDASDASGDEEEAPEEVKKPHDTMAFNEFLIWMRRVRCLELGKNWQSYQKVATETFGYVAHTELSTLVSDLSPLPELQEEFFRELGLEPAAPLSFDVLVCLRRHCSLMKDLTMEEARYFNGVFDHFQAEDHAGFVERGDCLCIFRSMGFGLNSDEIYCLLLDAKAAGHRLLSLSDFLNMMRACRSRQRGMIRTAYEMNAQEMGFSDMSDLEETGSALTMSDDEDYPNELIFSRRQSNDCSRAAFRRRSSIKQEATSKQVQGEGLLVPQGCLEALGSVGWSMEEDALDQGLARLGLQNQRLLSLDDFSSLVKLLREEEAAQKQRRAGWTVSEANDILCLFEAHGGSQDSVLGEGALEHLLWELDVKQGFEELKQLLEKARLQSGVELGGAPEVTLPTLMHLLRFISQKGLRNAFGRESEAFHVEGCTEADVATYRHLFRQIKSQSGEQSEHDGPPSLVRRSESGLRVPFLPGAKPGMHKIPSKCGSGLRKDYPFLLKKVKSALGVPSSIPQVSCGAVMKFLRKLSQRCDERLTPLQQADLWKKIQDFSVSSTSRDFMDFASFVRTIGWVRRTDFANIRQESDKVGSFLALAESILTAK